MIDLPEIIFTSLFNRISLCLVINTIPDFSELIPIIKVLILWELVAIELKTPLWWNKSSNLHFTKLIESNCFFYLMSGITFCLPGFFFNIIG